MSRRKQQGPFANSQKNYLLISALKFDDMRLWAILGIFFFSEASLDVRGQNAQSPYLFSEELEQQLAKDTTPWRYQIAATKFSFIGHYQRTLELWDLNGAGRPEMSSEDSARFFTWTQRSAAAYVLERAGREKIMIINEAHHNAKHRVFTRSLLKGLYAKGYRYLGLEALFDTTLQQRRYPVLESGFYTQEPEFGNLISEALKMGFTLFGYEAGAGKNGRSREIEQAQNIKTFMDAHPNGKVIIHCGFAHVYENEYQPWEKAMAGRLKEFTGLDPFTVNQESYSEKSSPRFTNPYVRWVKGSEPVVLLRGEEVFNGLAAVKQTDVIVIHPVTTYVNGRPAWKTSGRVPYRVAIDGSNERAAMIFAYRKGEDPQQAIPADLMEITANQDATLYLAKGSYEIIVKDRGGQILKQYAIKLRK